MVIFKSKPKKLEGDLKIELCIKSLYLRYLGVKIDANLSWQCNDLSIKPRANAVFFKIKYVSAEILIYLLCYFLIPFILLLCCLHSEIRTLQQFVILHKKVVRIVNFEQRNFHTSRLFKQIPR